MVITPAGSRGISLLTTAGTPHVFEFSRTRVMRSRVILQEGTLSTLDWKSVLPPPSWSSTHFVITDRNVDLLYGEQLVAAIRRDDMEVKKFVVPAGETEKSLAAYENLSRKILHAGVNKHSYLIGFGGGVVSNMTGFLASTLYRGIGLVQIPTSLMAQVDASIDFKQGINSHVGKNHLGSYYPASVILIDPVLTRTLSLRHIRNGLAESVKHALTQDLGFLQFLFGYHDKIVHPTFLTKVIHRTVGLKVSLLDGSHDAEYSEMLPQYGHPIGHALEQLSGYRLLHGEAIAIGMCVLAEATHLLRLCGKTTRSCAISACRQLFRKGFLISGY